ncbi:hypothetical protein HMPREF1556_01294 [Porphyromonas sp. oral taxon 278 str. W7784]|nr:hypothetical protein HMPREF1556_01294 [Porphyromonas sp. oral taxon 278 str. W7784]
MSESALRETKKDPTVGRRKNLLWVAETTYSGSLLRPTVDPKMGVSKPPPFPRSRAPPSTRGSYKKGATALLHEVER